MAISREQFLECLSKSGLLTAAELAGVQGGPPADATAICTELIRQKKLTSFQAAQLSQGQGKGLVYGVYTVLDRLGEGGMGVVYKAQHRTLKRVVALKVLHPSVMQDEEAVKRFHREVEAIARLTHPNVITAYDASILESSYYLVMEYADGPDLGRLVKEQGPLSVARAVEYAAQAARGLEYTHTKGVVHRDIKPSNLLLDGEGRVKILDMGLVRFTDNRGSDGATVTRDGLTHTGDIMGSFDYIAPEQALDTKRADHRADIYSLGCTLHYLLTGKAPYQGDTSMQKLLAHRENAIPSLRKARPETPLQLDAVFHRMVAKKPEDRYTSMAEAAADLEACLPNAAPVVSAPGATSAAPPHRPLPARTALLGGVACILAVVAGNVFLTYALPSHVWTSPDDTLLKLLALFAGIALSAVGVLLALAEARVGRGVRPAGRGLSLAGGLAGLLVGAVAGGTVGGALAKTESPETRLVATVVVGGVVGLALARRRAWLVVLLCALAGYFAGGAVGLHSLTIPSSEIVLPPDAVAVLGFGLVGAVVGAALGADRREHRTDKPRTEERPIEKPAPSASPAAVTNDALSGSRTVRRATEIP